MTDRSTPLHRAAFLGDEKAVRALLEGAVEDEYRTRSEKRRRCRWGVLIRSPVVSKVLQIHALISKQ